MSSTTSIRRLLRSTSFTHSYKIGNKTQKVIHASAEALEFACHESAQITMPTYVYKCAENSHIFEMVQKFSDEPEADCPTCGSASNRQISAPTVIYKGSGFYTTDYGSGSAPGTKSNGSSASSPSSSESSSDSSSTKSASDSSSDSGSGGHSHSHGAGSHTH